MSRGTRMAAACAALAIFVAGLAQSDPTPDSPDALLDAVGNSPNAKIGPWLDSLYGEYNEAVSRGVKDKSFKTRIPVMRVSGGTVGIDAYANDAAELKQALRSLGATRIASRGPLVTAQVPVRSLGEIAALPSLKAARPVLATTHALPPSAISQGDVSMNAPVARAVHDVDGSGIKVGTLSDTMACNPAPFQPGAPTTSYEEDLASGELPADTDILDNGPCGGATDEGRAMSQIVHDVAPGAAIRFHTAFNGEFDFAEGIIELADAGAKVIVDDVGYFAEPFFSDGMIAQAIDIVAGRGVSYFSSAGNQARDSYESAYRPVDVLVNAGKNLNGGKAVVRRFHNFGTQQSPSILQPVFLAPSSGAGFTVFSFQWDQPHLSATTYARMKAGQDASLAVGATSDLDMVFFDSKGHVIRNCPPGVATGITCQITGDPNIGGDAVDIAALFYAGPPHVAQLFYVGFVHRGGPDPGIVKYQWFDIQGTFGVLGFDTQSSTALGHSNSAGGQGVGAASWYVTQPFSTSGLVPPNDTQLPAINLSPCVPACLNDFSSAGGVSILFDRFGTRLSAPEIRQTPSVTGPDGGNSTFFLSDSSYDDDDEDGVNSPFSGFISCCDSPQDEFPNFFGTSASAPHVAAVAALMRQANPALTPAQVRQILEDTARPISLRFTSNRPTITFPIDDIGPGGVSFDAGHGLVDAAAALDAAAP